MSSNDLAISASGLGKLYHLYNQPQDRLKHAIGWRFGRHYGRAFWALRNDARHIVRRWWPLVSLDVSVPVAQMVPYVEETRRALVARWPAARLLPFGHVADNNAHMLVTLGEGTLERYDEIAEVVYAGVRSRRGSISAEHGIGLDKRSALDRHKPPEVLALMEPRRQVPAEP